MSAPMKDNCLLVEAVSPVIHFAISDFEHEHIGLSDVDMALLAGYFLPSPHHSHYAKYADTHYWPYGLEKTRLGSDEEAEAEVVPQHSCYRGPLA
jgi:hypothetical protein